MIKRGRLKARKLGSGEVPQNHRSLNLRFLLGDSGINVNEAFYLRAFRLTRFFTACLSVAMKSDLKIVTIIPDSEKAEGKRRKCRS